MKEQIFEVSLADVDMLRGKCYCDHCDSLFDEDEADSEESYAGECWGTPAYETFSVCPCCGGDYDEATSMLDRIADGSFEYVFSVGALKWSGYFVTTDFVDRPELFEKVQNELESLVNKTGVIDWTDEPFEDLCDYFLLVYSYRKDASCLYIVDYEDILSGYTQKNLEDMGYVALAEMLSEYTKVKGDF